MRRTRPVTDDLDAAVAAMIAAACADRTNAFTRKRSEKLRLRRELAAARDTGLRLRHLLKTSTTTPQEGEE